MTRRPARKTADRPGRKSGARFGGWFRRPKALWPRLRRWVLGGGLGLIALMLLLILAFTIIPPPRGPYMIAEGFRHDGIARDWAPLERISPNLARAVVAAEDANYCLHWGFDMGAIRQAIDDGRGRGASTISQQTVKNVFLWQGRSWPRKALEALLTPVVEAVWSKRRILEVYLNVAEFDTGVFGAEAAAQHYFGVSAADLTPTQAARLAAILPDPKGRSASKPSTFVRNRTQAILDGAATIRADGRDACFAA
jgi:monofunctional biosynthetic peptidoglycan transglycosylase